MVAAPEIGGRAVDYFGDSHHQGLLERMSERGAAAQEASSERPMSNRFSAKKRRSAAGAATFLAALGSRIASADAFYQNPQGNQFANEAAKAAAEAKERAGADAVG